MRPPWASKDPRGGSWALWRWGSRPGVSVNTGPADRPPTMDTEPSLSSVRPHAATPLPTSPSTDQEVPLGSRAAETSGQLIRRRLPNEPIRGRLFHKLIGGRFPCRPIEIETCLVPTLMQPYQVRVTPASIITNLPLQFPSDIALVGGAASKGVQLRIGGSLVPLKDSSPDPPNQVPAVPYAGPVSSALF